MDKAIKEKIMRLAIQEAGIAASEGNYPFGAVVTDQNGKIISKAHNTQKTEKDPTAHAEINIIRKLAKEYSTEEISSFILFCNAESCSMCFSAAIKAGFHHFVFGAPSEMHMEPYLPVSEVQKYCRQSLDITFRILAEECRAQIALTRKKQDDYAQ